MNKKTTNKLKFWPHWQSTYGYLAWVPSILEALPRSMMVSVTMWLRSGGWHTCGKTHRYTCSEPWVTQTCAQPYAEDIMQFVYLDHILENPTSCLSHAILAPINQQVNHYNDVILQCVHGTCWELRIRQLSRIFWRTALVMLSPIIVILWNFLVCSL